MKTLNFFLIRHNPTGFYLPEPAGRMGRGGSHVEPADPAADRPRIFPSRLSATRALAQWLRGKHHREWHTDWETGHADDDGVSVEPVPSRKREEMEIIEIAVTLP